MLLPHVENKSILKPSPLVWSGISFLSSAQNLDIESEILTNCCIMTLGRISETNRKNLTINGLTANKNKWPKRRGFSPPALLICLIKKFIDRFLTTDRARVAFVRKGVYWIL